MSSFKSFFLVSTIVASCAVWSLAQDGSANHPSASEIKQPEKAEPEPADLRVQPPPTPLSPASFDAVVDRVIEREHFFLSQMRKLHPLIETYIQNTRRDQELGEVPSSDHYFLGRLEVSNGTRDDSFLGQPGFGSRFLSKLTTFYSLKFLPLGFAQMVILDSDFQRKYYDFRYVRREFLGQVRCLVIDVQPKPHSGNGRFVGRVWVEDQDYNIVRFNGTYAPRPRYSYYLHFDSWRLNLRPGVWLPAYIYSQETDLKYRGSQTLRFKAQTRLWGYDLQRLAHDEEFTQIVVDEPESVHDQSESAQDAAPVQAQRLWQRQAEENTLDRLQKIGLLAPPGEVDKVLQTVVNNLEVTNNLNIDPEVRCRVLLTAPLESFTIGHTIVISRGLLDVLPDESSLAMVLSHELGHIALGHRINTKYSFSDRMLFPDERIFRQIALVQEQKDELAADQKGLELLEKSPYKDKLATAGLFVRALGNHSPELSWLVSPHFGNRMGKVSSIIRMTALAQAPPTEVANIAQIPALPLGSRIKMDPWDDHIEMLKSKPVALLSARDKMPFEVTPMIPNLVRFKTPGSEVATKQGTSQQ